MNYLGWPVFQFPINWGPALSRSFTLDLRQVSIGYGADVFTARQQFVVNGWNFQVDLQTEQQIADFDAFTAAIFGRRDGFWLPVPMEAAEIVASVDGTHFDVRGQRLTQSWADTPDIVLYFTARAIAPQIARITAVADNGNGTERITLNTAIVPAPFSEYSVFRLHFVRLADDIERASFPAEHYQERDVRVIEMPREYLVSADAGDSPAFLYHFWMEAPIDHHWYFTSFAADILSNDFLYRAKPITHSQWRRSNKFESESVDIVAGYEADHPLTLYLPFPPSGLLNVEILRVAAINVPNSYIRIFRGFVRTVNDNGMKLTANCDNFISILRQRIPAMLIKQECDYRVYDQRTCRAPEGRFQTSGFITAINNAALPPTVRMTLRVPTATREVLDYFAQGWIETGKQLDHEIRTIFSSVWDPLAAELQMTLSGPLLRAVVGQEAYIVPGCDGAAATCKTKFNNFVNFPGFREIPVNNPSLSAIETSVSQGNKK